MCMAAGIDPPAHLLVHGWLLVSGEKMSKSRANQIAPSDLTDDFGVDAVRYCLLRDTPVGHDGDFSYEGITARYNADLANNLGNLMARVATVVGSKCAGKGPAPDPDSRLRALADDVVDEATRGWESGQPHLALEAAWRLIRETNAELEATEPWKAEPGPAVDAVLGSALESLRIVALLASPAMPATSAEIWRRLGLGTSFVAGARPTGRRVGPVPRRLARREGRTPVPTTRRMSKESDAAPVAASGAAAPGWPAGSTRTATSRTSTGPTGWAWRRSWPTPSPPESGDWCVWAPTPRRRARPWPWCRGCGPPPRRRRRRGWHRA